MFSNPFLETMFAVSHALVAVNPFLAPTPMGRAIAAGHELCQYPKKIEEESGLDLGPIKINGHESEVTRTLIYEEPYVRFWLYEASGKTVNEPKLVSPPNSGQKAFPMAKGMVEALLEKGYPVFLRENIDPENVSIKHGPFGYDEDVAATYNFIKSLGKVRLDVFGQCQAADPSLRAGCLLGEEKNKNLRSIVTISGPINPKAAQTKITKMVDLLGPEVILQCLKKINTGGRVLGDGQLVCPKEKMLEGYLWLDPVKHGMNYNRAFTALMTNDRKDFDKTMNRYMKMFAQQNVSGPLVEYIVRDIFGKNLFVRDLATWRGRPISGKTLTTSVLHFGSEGDKIVDYRQATPKGLFPNAKKAKAHVFAREEHFEMIGDEQVARKIVGIAEIFQKDCARRDRPRRRTQQAPPLLREGLACALTESQPLQFAI